MHALDLHQPEPWSQRLDHRFRFRHREAKGDIAAAPCKNAVVNATRVSAIGGGNMAEALLRGLLEGGAPAASLRASDPDPARRRLLTERYGIATSEDNAAVARDADIVILAVKPKAVASAARSIAGALADASLVISVAAGVTTARIEAELRPGARVVRAMPNTAALVLAGATAITPGRHACPGDVTAAQQLFGAVGRAVVVPEDQLDAVTGLSGSGPAYVMLVIEALADGGVEAGLSREVALMLAAQTVFGAAKLQLESGEHPGVLKDRVTSPGGTTIAGLAQLEAGAVRSAFIGAVAAATARARALGAAERDPLD
jgi:pyrroline-5-carboxylate reductase